MKNSTVIGLLFVASLAMPGDAGGQTGPRFLVSAGPLLFEEGFQLGAGLSDRFDGEPAFAWSAGLDYVHIPYRVEHQDGITLESSGRETVHALLELEGSPFWNSRISPYGFAGFGWTWWWRDAEGSFDSLSGSGPTITFGGGVSVGLGSRTNLFTEVPLVIFGNDHEFGGDSPLRIGLSIGL